MSGSYKNGIRSPIKNKKKKKKKKSMKTADGGRSKNNIMKIKKLPSKNLNSQ